MKQMKIGFLLSLLTLLLFVSCIAENISKPEATMPINESMIESETAAPEPTLALETAVPPTTTEEPRTIRLTPIATSQIELVPTLAETAVVGEVPESIMATIYKDLTSVQNAQQEAITVVKAEAVIWNDGSLGCPQPGQVYTQALVKGYWIILEGNGRTYDYHATETGSFILCQNSLPLSPPVVGTPNS